MPSSPPVDPDQTRRVLEALCGELGAGIVVEAAPPDGRWEELVEPASLRGVPKRMREFATGRGLARRALERLGIHDALGLPGRDGAPRWPGGAVGSISHVEGLCVVACARARDWVSLGIDVERADAVDGELCEIVLRPDERPPSEAERLARCRRAFSAKEAVYKCQYPLSGRFLEFHDVRLGFDPPERAFVADVLAAPEGAPWARVPGRVARVAGHVVAVAALKATALDQ